MRYFKMILFSTVSILSLLAGFVWLSTYHPKKIEKVKIFYTKNKSNSQKKNQIEQNIPILRAGQNIKIMSWNVQYMAGKNYIFFYDLLDGSGPDTRPSKRDIAFTISEVACKIKEENPDIILLQEIDEDSARTDNEDQLNLLLDMLPGDYVVHSSAYYWKASFVPHPKIMGSASMKLSTISKYKINYSVRHALEEIPADPVTQAFNLKRAILETRFPIIENNKKVSYNSKVNKKSKSFVIMNTHLSAFAQGSDTMLTQVKQLRSLLDRLSSWGHSWIVGGDFNLLSPGSSYNNLEEYQKEYYNPKTELRILSEKYRSVPAQSDINGHQREKYFTHFPNDPKVVKPDRTIDYFFLSPDIDLQSYYVRRKDVLHISDHLPLIMQIKIPDNF